VARSYRTAWVGRAKSLDQFLGETQWHDRVQGHGQVVPKKLFSMLPDFGFLWSFWDMFWLEIVFSLF